MDLEIINLTKKFQGTNAVKNVSYNMNQGVYGLLGTNGAGKTTLMRMLCTLLRPSEGKILCDGEDIFKLDGKYRMSLGYLPQDFGFYPDFTVLDYLMYVASIKGMRPAAAKKRAVELLRKTGLVDVQNKKMKKLSGGMKRRAGIAQAMINDPKILILDEPTTALDPNERIRFRNLISELSEDRLVLLSTHIVSDVEYISKEILLMKKGEISLSGTSEEIIRSVPQKIWICTVEKNETAFYQQKYQVANMKSLSGGVELRILSEERPSTNSVESSLTLEDAFLYYFGKRMGEEDDIL